MKTFKLSLAVILTATGGGLLAEESTYTLESAVVSATGYEQDIKNAPASISVITGDEIRNKPIRDLGDIVAEVPGVTTTIEKTGASSIQIRGMSSAYTLILVDGKRMNMSKGFDGNGFDSTSGFLPPASMIERVEIIRGPASIIYGSDAMGGVINIITKKQPEQTQGSIGFESRFQQDSFTWGNTYGLNGAIFAPIDEKLSFNFRGKYLYGEKNRFYKRDINGFNLNGQTSAIARANPYTSHSPTGYKNLNIGGRLNYVYDDKNSFYFDTDYGFQRLGSLNTSASSITAVRDYEKYNFVLNHDGEYDFGHFNNYIQYANTSIIPHLNVPIGKSAGTPNHDNLTYNQALTLSSTFTKHFDFNDYGALILNAGPYYFYERLLKRQSANDKNAYQVALFGEGEYLFNDYVSSTAGLRLNKVQTYGIFAAPRFYVNVFPNDWLTLKAGIASGLQVPQLSVRYDGLYDTASGRGGSTIYYYGNKNLEPEKSTNYELSAIVSSMYGTFTITAFITDFIDAINNERYNGQAQIPGYGTCPAQTNQTSQYCIMPVNIDKARMQGVELSLNSKALLSDFIPRGVYFDFSYALTDTDQKSGAQKGKPLNNVPLHNLTSKISYKAGFWDTYLRYVGKYKTPTFGAHTANVGPGRWYKDVHTVDLGANYHFKNKITIAAVINNLFDQDTVDYVAYNNGASYTNNFQRMIPGRNLWLSLRADF